jgi:hypothetical protein
MIPTSIDGTDITGATIDGTDVQEITVDGDTVFSAGPSNLPVAYSNLIAWYPFDSAEYGGSNADDVTAIIGGSGDDTAYDGTVNGATYQSSGGVTDINAGANAGAFDFDGSNDDITLSGPTNNFNEITLMGWVFGRGVLITYFSSAESNDAQFVFDGDFQAALRGTGGSNGEAGKFVTFPSNTFVHAACTYDGSQVEVYKNGVLEDTNSGSIGQLDPADWRIGSDDVGGGEGNFHDGLIDDVRIYDTALSSSEINQIYQNTKP